MTETPLGRAIREAFRAGFMAHPDVEAPVFVWSFDPKTCAAADRESSAWEAYLAKIGESKCGAGTQEP